MRWEVTTLGQVVQLERNRNEDLKRIYLGLENIESDTGQIVGVIQCADDVSSAYAFEQDDVLYGRLRPYLNKVHLAKAPGCCSTEIFPLRTKGGLHPSWLSKFLKRSPIVKELNDSCTGARMPRTSPKAILGLRIPIPPLEEQERIVEVLDEAFAAIDKAKANIERNLTNARELFQSRLNDIFSNPSEDWEVTSLGEACVFIDYRGRTPKKTDAGIRLITAKNVRMGYVKTDPQEFMSSDEYEDWMTRGIPKKGDVLFTTEAPLANVAMFDFTEKVALAQRIITLSPKLGLSGEFLSFHLQSRPSQLEILSQATGATVSGIKSRLLKLIKIAFPSLESQNFIVDHLEKLKQEVTRLEADYLSELDNLEELRQSILEKAFEGKLTESVAA